MLFSKIHALKRRPNNDQAHELLGRLAAQVKPIMQNRGWKVGCLREFFPANPNLLGININYGQEIRIRLRPAHSHHQFLRYEDLLGTLLHELVHIVHGPHNSPFYKLLDELKAEAEQLMARGYTGNDGFFSGGKRVGHGVSHNVPLHKMREQRLKALENRWRLNRTCRTLGDGFSGTDWKTLQARLTPSQMAARAAERRIRDSQWCANQATLIADDTIEADPAVLVISDDDGDDDEEVIEILSDN